MSKDNIMIKMKNTEIDIKEIDPLSLVDGDVIYCALAEDDKVTSWLAAVKYVDEDIPEYMELYATLMLTTNGISDGEINYNTYQDIELDLLRYATEEEIKFFMKKIDEDNKERVAAASVVFDKQVEYWSDNVEEADFLAFGIV